MGESILYDAVVGPGATAYYGALVVSNLRYDGGEAVSIEKYLGVLFKSPALIDDRAVNVATNPWVEFTAEIKNEEIQSNPVEYTVIANLNVAKEYQINTSDTITITVNGDLTQDTEKYTKSFHFAADEAPNVTGTVNIEVSESPDSALQDYRQTVVFREGLRVRSYAVPLGETASEHVPAGNFEVTANELATSDETVVATAQVSPTSLTIEENGTYSVNITYGEVQTFSAINVTIGKIEGLENESFQVKVVEKDSSATLADFSMASDQTTALRRLPAKGTVVVSIGSTTVNNVQYSFEAQDQDLSAKLLDFSFSDSSVKKQDIDTTGFVELPIDLTSDTEVSGQINLRLESASLTYTQKIDSKNETAKLSVPVGPGSYKIVTTGFITGHTVYFVDSVQDALEVVKDGSTRLQIGVKQGPDLSVPGFPNFLSFGSRADLTPNNLDDFAATKASVIFKYAGVSGSGDSETYLSDDTSTRETLQLARSVEKKVNDGSPVIPILVSYTCNLSDGDTQTRLRDEDSLMYSFGNYILSLALAMETVDDKHPHPAAFVVNPDFLGTCEQAGIRPDFEMSVRKPLTRALKYRNVDATVPESISENLAGYVQAVNWLTHTVAPAVPFGWHVNPWGAGMSQWVYSDPTAGNPVDIAKQTSGFVRALGMYTGEYAPYFFAGNRYMADDSTNRGKGNGFSYGSREWREFFDYCRTLSFELKKPIMPWRIPSSWMPLTTDPVTDIFHLQSNPAISQLGETVKDVVKRTEPLNIGDAAHIDFPLCGIFSVVLDGDSSKGIVETIGNSASSVRDMLKPYKERPFKWGEGTSESSGDDKKGLLPTFVQSLLFRNK